jgi:hypothetical protein
LQKAQRHTDTGGIPSRICTPAIAIVIVVALTSFSVVRKSTVTFTAGDGLVLTADKYITSTDNPYILLFHEQESSRGEFTDIARKLCKMDYNCLAVDIRNGGSKNYVSNETAKRCRENRCPTSAADIELDMVAAIRYAGRQSSQPVILLGSGANGSLCLKLATELEQVKAVIALSPGEYFLPALNIEDTITGLDKPVFITSSQSEFPYVSRLSSGIDAQYLTLFEPQLGEGGRGTAALTEENAHNSEYWFALLLFFKELV